MNTRASVAYGWGVLILAGGGAYYFAKRSINADRAERAASIERERQYIQRMREQEYSSKPSAAITPAKSTKTRPKEPPQDPSLNTTQDPAPVGHVQDDGSAGPKFAAAAPFRSRKGDRFS